MSLTIECDAETIYDCEDLIDAVGVEPVLDELLIKRNSKSLSVSSEKDKPNAGFCGNIIDLTDRHFRLWYLGISFPNIDIKNNGGVSLYANDSNGGEAYWNIIGKETYYGGWINVVMYMSSTPDSGSVDLANLTEIGITHRNGLVNEYLTIPKKQINVWVDFMRISEGLVCYGTYWGMRDVAYADSAPGVGFGIVTHEKDIECVYGNLTFGKLTEITDYKDDGVTVVFSDSVVREGLFGIKLVGDETYSSDFEITNSVYISNINKFYLDLDDQNIHELIFTNNYINNASTIHFLSNLMYSTVTANIFNRCDAIYPQGCRFENNSINATTSDVASLNLDNNTAITSTKNIIYTRYQNRYALYLGAEVSGTITLDGHIFDKTGIDIYWAGTIGTLIIKLVNNSNPSTFNTAGGDIEFQIVDNIAIDYSLIETMLVDNNVTITDMVSSTSENLNQLILALGDNVDENQAIIESVSGNTRMFL